MINKDRIVPIQAIDLLSLYAVILKQDSDNSSITKLEASDVEGDFTVSTTGIKLANQPVKSCNFTAASGTLFFVADYTYEGFSVSGTAATPADGSDDVEPDGCTLYKAVLASGSITITKVGL
ncbi:MAG: hypothetical protein IKF75_01545 [Lachnospiraceae bacterium]|nr:hypothetical protein [Lachnospiraceae bacterium]